MIDTRTRFAAWMIVASAAAGMEPPQADGALPCDTWLRITARGWSSTLGNAEGAANHVEDAAID